MKSLGTENSDWNNVNCDNYYIFKPSKDLGFRALGRKREKDLFNFAAWLLPNACSDLISKTSNVQWSVDNG